MSQGDSLAPFLFWSSLFLINRGNFHQYFSLQLSDPGKCGKKTHTHTRLHPHAHTQTHADTYTHKHLQGYRVDGFESIMLFASTDTFQIFAVVSAWVYVTEIYIKEKACKLPRTSCHVSMQTCTLTISKVSKYQAHQMEITVITHSARWFP